MCECRDSAGLIKELFGLITSGMIICIFLYWIAHDLQKPTIIATEIVECIPEKFGTGIVTRTRTTTLSGSADFSDKTFHNYQMGCNTVPTPSSSESVKKIEQLSASLASGLASTYLEKLGMCDIFLLMVIWATGIFFSKTAHKLVKRIYGESE